MILAIDIGNTTIKIGLLKGKRVTKTYRIETTLKQQDLRRTLKGKINKFKNYPIKVAAVCSVVPAVTKTVETVLHKELKIRTYCIGRDIIVPIRNRYKNPKQVGQDRLVGAFAAMSFYGVPVVVVDFGTAITFDVVSYQKEYLGGIIVPGIKLSAESLFRKTALLPKINIEAPNTLIGQDTKNSILSGIFYGYGCLCQGLIDLISQKVKRKPVVVMTGGHTKLMKKYMAERKYIVDEDLVMKGIGLLLEARRLPEFS